MIVVVERICGRKREVSSIMPHIRRGYVPRTQPPAGREDARTEGEHLLHVSQTVPRTVYNTCVGRSNRGPHGKRHK